MLPLCFALAAAYSTTKTTVEIYTTGTVVINDTLFQSVSAGGSSVLFVSSGGSSLTVGHSYFQDCRSSVGGTVQYVCNGTFSRIVFDNCFASLEFALRCPIVDCHSEDLLISAVGCSSNGFGMYQDCNTFIASCINVSQCSTNVHPSVLLDSAWTYSKVQYCIYTDNNIPAGGTISFGYTYACDDMRHSHSIVDNTTVSAAYALVVFYRSCTAYFDHVQFINSNTNVFSSGSPTIALSDCYFDLAAIDGVQTAVGCFLDYHATAITIGDCSFATAKFTAAHHAYAGLLLPLVLLVIET